MTHALKKIITILSGMQLSSRFMVSVLLVIILPSLAAHAQTNPDLSRNVIIVGDKKFYPLKNAKRYYTHPHSPLLPHGSVSHGVKVIRPNKNAATDASVVTPDVIKSPAPPAAPATPSSPIVKGVDSPDPIQSSTLPAGKNTPATASDVLSLFEPEENANPSIKH